MTTHHSPARIRQAVAVLICLAGTGAAEAQSSVSIGGWLDIGAFKKTEGQASLGTIGRSNLAVSGSEDLGDGFAATFRLSTRFDLDTGTVEASDAAKPFWKGESTVGLKGRFGAVRLGRALTPLWEQSWSYDPWYNFDRIASPHWWQFAPDYLTNPQTREYARLNNGIFYDSPKLAGFHAHLSAGGDGDAGDLARSVGASFNYDQGDLSLMLGLERNSQKDKVLFVGGSYAFGSLKLMASYNRVTLNPDGLVYSATWTNWAGATDPTTRRTSYQVGASYAFGVSTIRAGYGRDQQGSTSGFNYIGSNFSKAGTGYSGPINMVSFGYVYNLSKRTALFADLSRSSWEFEDDNGHKSATGYALGMSHSF